MPPLSRGANASTEGEVPFLGMQVKGVVVVDDFQEEMAARGRWPSLEEVANEPIVCHVVDALDSAGVDDITVITPDALVAEVQGCLRSRERPERALRYLERAGPLDVAAALNAAAPIVGRSPCVVHAAAGLLGEPLGPLVARARVETPDLVLILHHGEDTSGHLSTATQKMLHLVELDRERAPLSMAGVCLFGPSALGHAAGTEWRAGSDVDLTLVAERITGAGGSFNVLRAPAWRRYSGSPIDLLELNRIALDRLGAEPHVPSNNGNRIEGRVFIDERASVRTSVIVGPAVIGPEAQISDAYIGPYTSIGAGAEVIGAEVERSIISPGARITHVGGRLVASVVGRDARVFRDFSLPRALRLFVGDGTEIALC